MVGTDTNLVEVIIRLLANCRMHVPTILLRLICNCDHGYVLHGLHMPWYNTIILYILQDVWGGSS